MSALGMIADDLTGACDAGVQFALRGLATLVWLDPAAAFEPAAMIVLPTYSRNDPPGAARAKVADACRALAARDVELIYKKIDSTLRGNLGAEIEAALEAAGKRIAFLAPAFPAMGRTVTHGWLRVDGEKTVHLPALLEKQGLAPERVAVFDTESTPELASVARAGLAQRDAVLLVGSAGLAAEVAALLGNSLREAAPHALAGCPVVVFTGSTHPATRAQIDFLMGAGLDCVVRPVVRGGEEACLAEFCRSLAACPPRGLVITGGDTAQRVCSLLGARAIRLDHEVVTGIPCGRLAGGPLDGTPVVTKAGGFGAPNVLARAVRHLNDELGDSIRSYSLRQV